MRPSSIVCASFVALALVGRVFVTSSRASPLPRNSDSESKFSQNVPGKLYITHAKVAYYYSRDGHADTQKNVASFTNPFTGVYCILPSVKLGYPDTYPQVTIDWGNSIGNALFAYVLLHSNDCPPMDKTFEVLTYDGSGQRTGNVSFIFSNP